MTKGRLTLPIERGMDDQLRELIAKLGADAVRNSDGTELPQIAHELLDKVYATYFPARGEQEWADSHPEQATRIFLMSPRVTAMDAKPLTIDILAGYLRDQFAADLDCDVERMWQVIDRTTGEVLSPQQYQILAADDTTEAAGP